MKAAPSRRPSDHSSFVIRHSSFVIPHPMNTPWAAYLCLAASMALVGSYVGLSKQLVAVLPVFLLMWLRFGIGALAMAHWMPRPPHEVPLSKRDRGLLFLQSLLGNFLFSICMLFGVALTSAVAAGVVMAAIPAAVALLSWLFLRERIGMRMHIAIVLAIVGVAWLALHRSPAHAAQAGASASALWGYALLLAAVFCEASYVVIGKRLTGSLSPRRISALINLWGLALVTPLGLWQATRFDFAAVPATVWGLLVFYALAASVWSVWLWMKGLAQVAAARAGVFTVMLPMAATLVGVLWLNEPFGTAHAVAFALAVAGLLVATWPPGRPAPRLLPPH
jgi:drug/metabolite transporter (DMT)-like permease